MPNKLLELHPAAVEELTSALIWYRERSRIAAVRFMAEIDSAMNSVISAPDRWPRGKDGTRRFILHRFPFVIVYRDLDSAIQVLAVAHGYRKPGYWRNRL